MAFINYNNICSKLVTNDRYRILDAQKSSIVLWYFDNPQLTLYAPTS